MEVDENSSGHLGDKDEQQTGGILLVGRGGWGEMNTMRTTFNRDLFKQSVRHSSKITNKKPKERRTLITIIIISRL